MQAASLCIVCSIDWESRSNYAQLHLFDGIDFFEKISREILNLFRKIVDGKMVWYAKVDFYADITYYNQFDELAAAVQEHGGQLGIHIHHTSCDPLRRKVIIRRAVQRMVEAGFPVMIYSAGMGNRIATDTSALIKAGNTKRTGRIPLFQSGDATKQPLGHFLCNFT